MAQQKVSRLKILIKKLEGAPKVIFEKRYRKIIRQEIANKPGVYALYDKKDNLYYVGRASKLARRINAHLKDQHSGKWTHFSVYFTKEKYVHEVEAIILSILPNTKGNRQKSNLGKDIQLKTRIRKAMREIDKKQTEFRKFGVNKKIKTVSKKKIKTRVRRTKESSSFKNPFGKSKLLKKIYKNKPYKAIWLKSGRIKYKDEIYNSPSSAAKAILKRNENGLQFWRVQDSKGEWIRIKNCG